MTDQPDRELETLPQAIHSETLEFLGYKLTAHVLDDGRRVFEDTPELRRLIADLTDAGAPTP